MVSNKMFRYLASCVHPGTTLVPSVPPAPPTEDEKRIEHEKYEVKDFNENFPRLYSYKQLETVRKVCFAKYIGCSGCGADAVPCFEFVVSEDEFIRYFQLAFYKQQELKKHSSAQLFIDLWNIDDGKTIMTRDTDNLIGGPDVYRFRTKEHVAEFRKYGFYPINYIWDMKPCRPDIRPVDPQLLAVWEKYHTFY